MKNALATPQNGDVSGKNAIVTPQNRDVSGKNAIVSLKNATERVKLSNAI